MNLILTLIRKDYLVDLRQKYRIAGIGLYIFSTIYIAYLAFNNVITPSTWNALLWIVLLFASTTGLIKSFGQEENRSAYYYFLTTPTQILLAKLIYHLAYQAILVTLTLVLFKVFLGGLIENYPLFILNLSLGALGIAVAFTLISSLASKTQNQSTMMAVLGFPVVIPVLLVAVANSRKVILGAEMASISGGLITLVCINVVIIALSFILFPYSWKN